MQYNRWAASGFAWFCLEVADLFSSLFVCTVTLIYTVVNVIRFSLCCVNETNYFRLGETSVMIEVKQRELLLLLCYCVLIPLKKMMFV
jgi:hypothetical protein